MISWPEQLDFMRVVAARYPHVGGQSVAMCRRDKRGRGRLRPRMILSMRVAATTVVRSGEQALVDRDGRRRLEPHEVYDMRIRALRLERDEALAAEYGVSQSSATRAIDGDTYRDVPFPIRISHPDVPIEIYYPYSSAISILAAAPIDQQFTITIQPHTPRLRIAGLLRLADQVPATPPPPQPHTTVTPAPQEPSTQTSPPPAADRDRRASQRKRRRRFG